MKRKRDFLCNALWLMTTLAFSAQYADAQDTIMTDTVNMDELIAEKPPQIPLEQSDVVDICESGRYAIISRHGKRGIYDLMKGENVTEIDLDDVGFSRHVVAEDSIHICYFWAEKGLQSGIIGVAGNDNQTLGIWMDNPDLVATLTECTTIDKDISNRCHGILMDAMSTLGGEYGQIAVLDASTGQLKAWVALEKDTMGISNARLLKKSCSPCLFAPLVAAARLAKSGVGLNDSIDTDSGVYSVDGAMVIRDHNWRKGGYGKTTYRKALTGKSAVAIYKALLVGNSNKAMQTWKGITSGKKETNAMELAAVINSMYHLESLCFPSLEKDSIKMVDMSDITSRMKEYIRIILSETNSGSGIQADFAPKGISVAGLYGLTENGKTTELSYAGCFPIENPRYAIGVFIDLPSGGVQSERILAGTVNRVIEWLDK